MSGEERAFMHWTMRELDAMHILAGLGDEWLASDRRAELLENPEPA